MAGQDPAGQDRAERLQAEAAERQRQWGLLAVGLLGAAGVAVVLLALFVPDRFTAILIGFAGLAVVVLAFARAGRFMRDGNTDIVERKMGGRRDVAQGKWAYAVGIVPITSLPVCMMSSEALWQMANGAGDVMLSKALLGPLLAACWFVYLMFGHRGRQERRWLHDELMVAYHGSAVTWGFAAAFAGLGVLFGLMVWKLPVAMAAMPYVMLAVVWVAGLRLWWQVRRAEGG
ncbi:hypothetical protein [Brevundimonas sp.]|uniref:hypothetical protein n=1 Tax=Brevundimonas sp. TaxID=1871086 RepID=UPI002FC73B60